ncbi:MAG: sodium-dependent transporter [Gammaproteobacteria bacterium]|nr:sodium-dependent transporter [Gammaproteobacteria bacterium]
MTAPANSGAQENWSSRLTFLMASIGFAVGLGNIWRFPYVVGENGGSAFVLVYLLFAFGIGVPLVMAEWTIGRRGSGAASASGSVREVARQSGASTAWGNVGGIAVLAVFMLMLFYTVVAGWTMDYLARAASGAFQGIDAERSKAMFDSLLASPLRLGFWHAVVVLLTVYINSRGLKAGIEKAVNILMPALFVSLLLMVGYASSVGDFGAAVEFLLTPDFSRVTAETMLMALGQAFFSIGIAMAVMITYGSYLDKQTSIPRNAFIVVGADTLVAMLAGFAIFPLVFAHQLAPDSGAGLVFQTLPIAFGDLPGGQIFASIFFFLLIAAAITSCIGNFAPVVAWTEERFSMGHAKSAGAAGFVMWLLGLGAVFSFNLLSDFHPLSFIGGFQGMTIYDSLDYVMSNVLLPVGAFLTALFIGWFASSEAIREEMGLPDGMAYKTWRVLIRFIVPVAVAMIFAVSITG